MRLNLALIVLFTEELLIVTLVLNGCLLNTKSGKEARLRAAMRGRGEVVEAQKCGSKITE